MGGVLPSELRGARSLDAVAFQAILVTFSHDVSRAVNADAQSLIADPQLFRQLSPVAGARLLIAAVIQQQ